MTQNALFTGCIHGYGRLDILVLIRLIRRACFGREHYQQSPDLKDRSVADDIDWR